MSHKTKKLEILDIDDIKSLENKNLSKKVNHYLQKTLFTIRILFRHNEENIDDLIDFYYYIEDVLDDKIYLDEDELKILIYRVTDLVLNIEDYGVCGGSILIEPLSQLEGALLLELEKLKLKIFHEEDELWQEIIDSQIKDNEVEFNVLIKILGEDDVGTIKKEVVTLLKQNYQQEYLTYLSRKDYLEY